MTLSLLEQTPLFHRQLDILSPTQTTPVVLIGAGSIGSAIGVMLAKLGVQHLTIFDPDTIEDHNLSNQLFPRSALSNNKAEALKDFLELLAPTEGTVSINAQNNVWDNETIAPVVIVAVDSMSTRKEIYEVLKTKYGVITMVDTRMGGEKMRLYAGRPSDPGFQSFYEANLYDDSEADELPCTARTIVYNVFSVAGLVGSILKKSWIGEPYAREIIFDLDSLGFYKG